MSSSRRNQERPGRRQKLESMARKREERAAKAHYRKQKKAQSYLTEDEGFVSFSAQLAQMGLQLRDIPGDGNCLFRALGDQFDSNKQHGKHRQEVVEYMRQHRDDFEPFVEDDVSFDRHVANLKKPGTYAGNDAIVAFARLHKVHVVIHQLNSPCWEIHGTDDENARQLHISYHNGDHYSSVRKVGDSTDSPPNIRLKPSEVSAKPKPAPDPEYWNGAEDDDDDDDYKHAEVGDEFLFDDQDELTNLRIAEQQAATDEAQTLQHAFGDVCDIEDQVMEETGCKDRLLVRQALEETDFNVDEAVIFTLQLMQTSMSSFHPHSFLDADIPDSGILADMDGSHLYGPSPPDTTSASSSSSSTTPTHNSGAKPKKSSRHTAREKKAEKKRRAMERHKAKLQGDSTGTGYTSGSWDEEEELLVVQSMGTLKI